MIPIVALSSCVGLVDELPPDEPETINVSSAGSSSIDCDCEYDGESNLDLSTFDYTGNQYTFEENTQPESISIIQSEQKIFMLGTAGTATLYRYSFGFRPNGIVDLDTVNYDNVSTTLSPESKCFRFSPDGMFLVTVSAYIAPPSTEANILRTYELSSPYDIASKNEIGSLNVNANLASVSTSTVLTANARGFEFSGDGLKMWVVGNLSTNPQTYPQHLYEYSLTSPYDVGSATFVEAIDYTTAFAEFGIERGHSGILDAQEIRWVTPTEFVVVFATSTNKYAVMRTENPYDLSSVTTDGKFFNPPGSYSHRGFDFIRRFGFHDRLYTLPRNTRTLHESKMTL